jgi:TRAP-type mannitol/chloroaromatic compound transport system permease small subunit
VSKPVKVQTRIDAFFQGIFAFFVWLVIICFIVGVAAAIFGG